MAQLGGQGLRGQRRREGGAAEPSGSVEFLHESSLRAEKQDSQKRKLQEQSDAVLDAGALVPVPRVKAAEREAKETNRLYAELERRMPRRAIWRAPPRPGQDS